MTTIKSYSDLQQSKKLAEILPLESADMRYGNEDPYKITIGKWKDNEHDEDDIPCWSLAALLGVLPEIQGGKPAISLNDNYITYPRMSGLHTEADNLVDACYEMILKLHELNLL